MEIISYIICFLYVIHSVSSKTNDECFTPDNLRGVCINIDICPSIRMLLETQSKNSSIVGFINKSICGWQGRAPEVCCVLENVSLSPTSTQTPKVSQSTSSHLSTPLERTCGKSSVSHDKIVGGVPAKLGAWPWIAALGYRDFDRSINSKLQWLCGGSLISNRYVLTAAHCTINIGNRELEVVRLGELDLNSAVDDNANETDIRITHIIRHKRYNADIFINDIALLKLESTVTFNNLIQPICLPISEKHRNNLITNLSPFVAGWGATAFNGPSTTKLMEIQVSVYDNDECKEIYAKDRNVVDSRVLCALSAGGGSDACQGDSGGPLMWPNEGQYYVMGIVSYGAKCGLAGYPGVYTRVTAFVDWIQKNSKDK